MYANGAQQFSVFIISWSTTYQPPSYLATLVFHYYFISSGITLFAFFIFTLHQFYIGSLYKYLGSSSSYQFIKIVPTHIAKALVGKHDVFIGIYLQQTEVHISNYTTVLFFTYPQRVYGIFLCSNICKFP